MAQVAQHFCHPYAFCRFPFLPPYIARPLISNIFCPFLPFCQYAILPFCHSAILPFCHSAAGFYHSALLNSHSVSEESPFWEVAARCQVALDRCIEHRKHFTDMGDLNMLMAQVKTTEGSSLGHRDVMTMPAMMSAMSSAMSSAMMFARTSETPMKSMMRRMRG